jgi:hypothetical protein
MKRSQQKAMFAGMSKEQVKSKVISMKQSGEIYNHPKLVNDNIFMVDYSTYEPAQQQLAEELAYEKVGNYQDYRLKEKEIGFDGVNKLIEKKVARLSSIYYQQMDKNPVEFLIKNKVGKNVKDLVDNNYLKLDVDDITHDIINN